MNDHHVDKVGRAMIENHAVSCPPMMVSRSSDLTALTCVFPLLDSQRCKDPQMEVDLVWIATNNVSAGFVFC